MKEGPKKALDSYNKSLKLDPKNFANIYIFFRYWLSLEQNEK